MTDSPPAVAADELARIVEHAEAAAYADLLRAAPAEWGCRAEPTGAGWFLMAPPLDMLLFNRIVACGVGRPAERSELAALVDRYRRAGVRHFGVQLSPAAQPAEVARWLAAAGLAPGDRWTKVYRAAVPVPPPATPLRIEPVGAELAVTFAALTTAGFGMPPQLRPWIAATVGRPRWRQYVAFQGEEPVAAGALFIESDIGWLGIASTLPAARRRGAQGALMARRLADGAALGCRWFVTETGEDLPQRPNPSFHNMMRAGFKVAYHRPNLVPT